MSIEGRNLEPETDESLLKLPEAPSGLNGPVKAWRQAVEILTYEPANPDLNPMFFEKRVYQGSSGRVYPLPFIDRIATEPKKRSWQAIHIENEYLRLMILPEIGGRIHVGLHKTTEYDFFYRQNVIKPALVGLAGPWISGGVEFNWPQHHRPATFMPVETEIEQDSDGSVTVWCSDHDPMLRMKGMHGICLRPGRTIVELKVRLFNRTPYVQTFLWWANVATRVHEKYQSFFPTDVRFVADHAKRAVTTFPQSTGTYYGVDYAGRAASGVPIEEKPRCFQPDGSYPPNDLSWYSNIPVPTSYMITKTEEDFFGGYDHAANAGVVHVANHHISPGKKQWTWGNHEFGYAWDRSLTDHDGPYIELMAGVYTDNQPDFSFLAPWETKTFAQNWFPIQAIGIPQASNLDAALNVRLENRQAHIGICGTHSLGRITVFCRSGPTEIDRREVTLDVTHPVLFSVEIPEHLADQPVSVRAVSQGATLIEYDPAKVIPAKAPAVAIQPPGPLEVETVEELYLTGLHLSQYRHATWHPEAYWHEALKREPEDSRVNSALGLWHMRQGEFDQAAAHFETAIARLTRLNPNPYDGEPYYNLGIVERFRGHEKEAYDALYKATWNAAWRSASYFALAEIDASRGDWQAAHDHVKASLAGDADNLNARNLLVLVLKRLGRDCEAEAEHRKVRALDPLDLSSRFRDGIPPRAGQECLDLAYDLMRCGQLEDAARLLRLVPASTRDGSLPIVLFTLAQIETRLGSSRAAELWAAANEAPLDYCFPSRLEEMQVLRSAIAAFPNEPSAYYLLGNWLYDRCRHEEAIQAWESAARLNPKHSTVWRNLGIAMFNIRGSVSEAKAAFDLAFTANPKDGRVLYERDQLWKRIGVDPTVRMQELQRHIPLVSQRDDLSVELATLYNQLGRPEAALELLSERQFQPWEGGEGLVLAQYVRSRMLLGKQALSRKDDSAALEHFRSALQPPKNLGEAKHLLANQSELYYWIGKSYEALGHRVDATTWWERAAHQHGDFQRMSVCDVSEMTYWTGMAELSLGDREKASRIFESIYVYSIELEGTTPKIDYFATSLPTMLLFDEDLALRNRAQARFLRAQALVGLNRTHEAATLLEEVLHLDRNHTGAADLIGQLGIVPAGAG